MTATGDASRSSSPPSSTRRSRRRAADGRTHPRPPRRRRARDHVLRLVSAHRRRQFSLLDFYVLVDSYWTLGTSRLYAALNALLPPNVYYIEFADGGADGAGEVRRRVAGRLRPLHVGERLPALFLGTLRPAVRAGLRGGRGGGAGGDGGVGERGDDVRATRSGAGAGSVRGADAVDDATRAELSRRVRAERTAVVERLYDGGRMRYERVTRAAVARMPYRSTARRRRRHHLDHGASRRGGPGRWAVRRV